LPASPGFRAYSARQFGHRATSREIRDVCIPSGDSRGSTLAIANVAPHALQATCRLASTGTSRADERQFGQMALVMRKTDGQGIAVQGASERLRSNCLRTPRRLQVDVRFSPFVLSESKSQGPACPQAPGRSRRF
jgi:hypothetical protein